MHVDHILVLDGGRLVEHERHEDLPAHGGIYHDLWNKQAGFISEMPRTATVRARTPSPLLTLARVTL